MFRSSFDDSSQEVVAFVTITFSLTWLTGFDSTGQYSYRLENVKKSVGGVILMRLKWKMAERKTEWAGTAGNCTKSGFRKNPLLFRGDF